MADVVDMAAEIERHHLERSIAAARVPVPAGEPGDCEDCGDFTARLVDGRCAPCREPHPRIPRRY